MLLFAILIIYVFILLAFWLDNKARLMWYKLISENILLTNMD